jgi:hypothetical protein
MMYIEGLNEPMRGWVKYFKPVTLEYATECTQDLVGEANKNMFTPRAPIITMG